MIGLAKMKARDRTISILDGAAAVVKNVNTPCEAGDMLMVFRELEMNPKWMTNNK